LRPYIDRGIEFYFGSLGRLVTKETYAQVRAMLLMQAEMACQYNERLSFRIREAMKSKREKLAKGVLAFGRLPAWLTWSAPRKVEGRKPVVVEVKADVVRKIFGLYLQGKGCLSIAEAMRGMPTITGHKRANWNHYFVYRLLQDRAVIGEYTSTQTPGIFPPIISENDFLKVAERLKTNSHQSNSERTKNANLFSGLATCSRCGHMLTRLSSPRNGVKYFYLVCGGRARRVEGCKCDFKSVNYTAFEASFLSLLKESGLIRKMLASDHGPSPVDDLQRKLADVTKRADVMLNVLEGTGAEEAGRIGQRLRVLEAEEKAITAQLAMEVAKAKLAAPVVAYDHCVKELVQHAQEPEGRARIRNSLPEFLEKITVDLAAKQYEVMLRGAKMPIVVSLNKNGPVFVPSVPFALGQPCPDDANRIDVCS
jgi:hypothetical protein